MAPDLTPIDWATALNAALAGLALGLRGNMLKPEARAWASSRAASLIIVALSVFMGGYAIDVFGRGGASPRELAIVSAVAVSSVAMLIHLWRQRSAPRESASPPPHEKECSPCGNGTNRPAN